MCCDFCLSASPREMGFSETGMLGLGAAFSIRNNARYTTSGMIAVQPAPAVAAQQQHKLAVEQHAGFQLGVFHLRSHEFLIVPVANGNDEAASLSKLACEYLGNFRSAGGDEDCVV